MDTRLPASSLLFSVVTSSLSGEAVGFAVAPGTQDVPGVDGAVVDATVGVGETSGVIVGAILGEAVGAPEGDTLGIADAVGAGDFEAAGD